MLTLVSASVGLFVGYALLRALGALGIQDLPRGSEIRLDGVVAAWTVAIAAAIGIVLGLIPVASALPVNLTTALHEEGRSGTAGRGARTLRRALVVAQVAFAFVLLIGAGLLFASFRRVLAVDPGFNADGVLTASITLPRSRYAKDEALIQFTDEALRRIRALPGVVSAGATTTIPFGGNNNDSVILAEGYQMKPGESVISPQNVDVTPLATSRRWARSSLRGRFFDERDAAKSPRVIIVDEKLAKRFWPGQDPIGRRMYSPTDINKLLADHRQDRVLDRRRRHRRHEAARSRRGAEGGRRVLLSDGAGRRPQHDVRRQDRRRSRRAHERGARRHQRASTASSRSSTRRRWRSGRRSRW